MTETIPATEEQVFQLCFLIGCKGLPDNLPFTYTYQQARDIEKALCAERRTSVAEMKRAVEYFETQILPNVKP